MGMWGVRPYENDAAADWYDATFELTGLAQHVEETLNLNVAEYADEIRAAAHLLAQLNEHYIWPIGSRERCLKLAVKRLTEIIEKGVFSEPQLVADIQEQIRCLQDGDNIP